MSGTAIETGGEPLRDGYDRVAAAYAARFADELEHKPLDRALLDRFADRVRALGPVVEVGCGPGQVARYLHDRRIDVSGVDLAPAMVAEAARLHPSIPFRVGDLRALDVPPRSLGGVVAFYAIIHVPRDEVVAALASIRRALRPSGLLLLTFHIGRGIVHRDEFLGQPVAIDFVFFEPDEMARYLADAGFSVVERDERDPYPEVEFPSRRASILAEAGP